MRLLLLAGGGRPCSPRRGRAVRRELHLEEAIAQQLPALGRQVRLVCQRALETLANARVASNLHVSLLREREVQEHACACLARGRYVISQPLLPGFEHILPLRQNELHRVEHSACQQVLHVGVLK